MKRSCVVALAAFASGIALYGATARAQRADDLASAEALFDEGKRLMAAGDYGQACPKLVASLRLDVGIGAMLYLAECYFHSGQTASAWAQFREAAALAASRRDAREELARERARRLEAHLSKLVVDVSDSNGPNVVVRRDGQVLDRAAWATQVPVDPGVHLVEASAPGKSPFRATIVIESDGSTSTLVVPPLEDVTVLPATASSATASSATASSATASPATASPATASPATASPASSPALPPRPENSAPASETTRGAASDSRGEPLGAQRAIAIAVAGLGLLGVGTGSYWGLRAKSLLDDSNSDGHCSGNQCDRFGVQARTDAQGQADLSTIAFTAAAIGIVGGAVLWLATPHGSTRMAFLPSLGPRRPALFVVRF
ncbi:MAG: hypothetical protein ABSC94_22560 [Polyangiaceae bacterium]